MKLRRLLPEVPITPYGVIDGFLDVKSMFHDPEAGPAFLTQYVKFLAASIPGNLQVLDKDSGRKSSQFTSKLENLILIFGAVSALVVAAISFSNSGPRRRPHKQANYDDML